MAGRNGRRKTAAKARFAHFTAFIAGLAAILATQEGPPAMAYGDDRSLTFFHTHRGDTITVAYKKGGLFDEDGLNQLNHFLRDWRNDQETRMDPRLFDVVWEAYHDSGSQAPIQIISAYRSPVTNAMLHRRSRAVAEHSQHMLGKAMDIRLADVDTARLRATAMRLQHGGVGYYSTEKFVHVDTGSIRAWPRMTQDQLAKLFPDGKTVHLPSSGKPLPGYQDAKATLLARGETVEGVTTVVAQAPIGRKSFFAALFGSKQQDQPATTTLASADPSAMAYAAEADAPADSTPLPLKRPPNLPGATLSAPAKPVDTAALATVLAGVLSREAGWDMAGDQRAAVQALFAVRIKPEAPTQVRIAEASVKAAPAPAVAGMAVAPAQVIDVRFTAGPATDLAVSRFTGPAVQGLRLALLDPGKASGNVRFASTQPN